MSYVHMEYYSATKKWNNAICSNMDGPGGYHNKWSKSEKEIPYEVTYMWYLKIWHKKTETVSQKIHG